MSSAKRVSRRLHGSIQPKYFRELKRSTRGELVPVRLESNDTGFSCLNEIIFWGRAGVWVGTGTSLCSRMGLEICYSYLSLLEDASHILVIYSGISMYSSRHTLSSWWNYPRSPGASHYAFPPLQCHTENPQAHCGCVSILGRYKRYT